MRYVILNGAAIGDRSALYDALEAHLDLPDYFGRNLDALHDVLGDLLAGGQMTFEVRDADELLRTLGRYGEAFLHVLKDTAREDERLILKLK